MSIPGYFERFIPINSNLATLLSIYLYLHTIVNNEDSMFILTTFYGEAIRIG